MVLALLLAACISPRSGVYEVVFTGAESDCAAPVVAEATGQAEAENGFDGRVVHFFGDAPCALEGAGFACDLADWDRAADLTGRGADLVWQADWAAEGAWTDGRTAAGTVALAVTCEGADCVAPAVPQTCAVTWSWAATWLRDGEPERCEQPVEPPPAELVVTALGPAADDPIQVDVDADWTPAPLVLGPDGVDAPEAVLDGDAIVSGTGLFLPPDGWAVGAHTVLGAFEAPEAWAVPLEACQDTPVGPVWLDADEPFVTAAYGESASFDAARLVDTRWEVTAAPWFAGGAPMPDALLVGPIFLEIGAVADGKAAIRLQTDACTLLEDVATIDAAGHLAWARERIEAATEPSPLVLYSPSFSVDFAEDRSGAAGGRVRGLVDVRAAQPAADVCGLADGFGAACGPCPDDGVVACLDVAGRAWQLTNAGVPGDSLPWCGVDFDEAGEYSYDLDLECEAPGAVCALSTFGVGVPLVVLRRRRRAKG